MYHSHPATDYPYLQHTKVRIIANVRHHKAPIERKREQNTQCGAHIEYARQPPHNLCNVGRQQHNRSRDAHERRQQCDTGHRSKRLGRRATTVVLLERLNVRVADAITIQVERIETETFAIRITRQGNKTTSANGNDRKDP